MNPQRQITSASTAIAEIDDIIEQRRRARELAETVGMRLADQARAVMCVTELVENIVKHTPGGECTLSQLSSPRGIRIVCSDRGSGIPNLDQLLRERADTPHDLLGAGLIGVRRIADHFEIESGDDGTTVCVECVTEDAQ